MIIVIKGYSPPPKGGLFSAMGQGNVVPYKGELTMKMLKEYLESLNQ
jgi:hypothetical protein